MTGEPPPSDVTEALAALWVDSYGPAADLVHFLKKHPDDPRSVDVPKIEPLLKLFLEKVPLRDVAGAAIVSAKINRAMFHCSTRELAPLVKTGRKVREKFAQGRGEANSVRHDVRAREHARWQVLAVEYWSRKKGATKNEVANAIKKRLGLAEATKTIARDLKKPGQAS